MKEVLSTLKSWLGWLGWFWFPDFNYKQNGSQFLKDKENLQKDMQRIRKDWPI